MPKLPVIFHKISSYMVSLNDQNNYLFNTSLNNKSTLQKKLQKVLQQTHIFFSTMIFAIIDVL